MVTKCYKQLSSLTRSTWSMPGPRWRLQAAGCFTEAIRGFKWGSGTRCHAQPSASRSNQSHAWRNHPISQKPDAWKLETDCDAMSAWLAFNYSLLRLWHVPKDLHQFVDQLNQQMNVIICSLVGRLTMTSLRVESSISSRLTTFLKPRHGNKGSGPVWGFALSTMLWVLFMSPRCDAEVFALGWSRIP